MVSVLRVVCLFTGPLLQMGRCREPSTVGLVMACWKRASQDGSSEGVRQQGRNGRTVEGDSRSFAATAPNLLSKVTSVYRGVACV